METESAILKLRQLIQEIVGKTLKPGYRVPGGGEITRVLKKFVTKGEETFGELTSSRLADLAVTAVYSATAAKVFNPKTALSVKAIEKYATSRHGMRHYENEWLRSHGLSRELLSALAGDCGQHPLAPYLFMKAEEPIKRRLLNTDAGFFLCVRSTTGWSPFSPACRECVANLERCRRTTDKNYPELYRLRNDAVRESEIID